MNILFSIISNKLISLTEKDLPWLIDYLEKSIKGPFNRTSEKWKRLPRSAYCQLAKQLNDSKTKHFKIKGQKTN